MIALAKKLTVSQTLFLSHLLLALIIVAAMSVARYESEWQHHIDFSVLSAKQSLQPYVGNYSIAVSGINYTAMTQPSLLDGLADIDHLLFIEVKGLSDYYQSQVNMRYIPAQKQAWRATVSDDEVARSTAKIARLETQFKQLEPDDTLGAHKLSYLLEKAYAEQELLQTSIATNKKSEVLWQKPLTMNNNFYLDQSTYTLHVVLPLRNENGGYIWAVFDAKNLELFKRALSSSIALWALLALTVALLIVSWVAIWIVNPLKNLANSMINPISYKHLDQFPELERTDEIGQLARAYRGLLVKNDQQLDSLRAMSDKDSLTGLGSRYKYSRLAHAYIQRNLEMGKVVGLMICDIDNFKAYNDIYGHMDGDKALVNVATRLQASLTNVDMAFRYGGEEFVILCSRHDERELERMSELIRRSVQNDQQVHKGNPGYDIITISIGAASTSMSALDHTIVNYDQVVKVLFVSADQALYECKHAGRNRSAWVNVFNTEIEDSYSLAGTKR